jgi:arsenate reductase (glutaredoxin)
MKPLTSINYFFFLSTCSTCARIIKECGITPKQFEMIDVKPKIDAQHLNMMREHADSYACLFSKAAVKYRAMGLHERELSEDEQRNYILKEYTFLRRPIAIIGDSIFIGNSKKNIEALAAAVKRMPK